jgi:acetyl esterase
MPLDPAVQGMLALLESLNRPPMSQGTPEAARQAFRMLTVDLRQPDAVVQVGAVDDLKVPGEMETLAARRYRPDPAEAGEGPLPTVVFFHGGGFVIGDLDTHDNQCRWVCREVGAVVLSVAYRTAPEAPFPAAGEDCLAAVRWAAAHIDELGGDPGALVLAGDSAGANLAAVTAQACRDAGEPALAAQLLVYPATDLTDDAGERYPSRADNAEGYFLTADDMRWFGGNYVGGADPADPRLSPLHGTLEGLPPAVVVTAEYDPLRDEGEAYARALDDAGVPVVQRRFDGLIHGFFDLAALSPTAADAVRETCAELKDLLTRTR